MCYVRNLPAFLHYQYLTGTPETTKGPGIEIQQILAQSFDIYRPRHRNTANICSIIDIYRDLGIEIQEILAQSFDIPIQT